MDLQLPKSGRQAVEWHDMRYTLGNARHFGALR